MPVVAVRIPQMGEGLQEARLVSFLKNPGDTVRRDEPIYQMETDKAVMDVESPYEGKLLNWLATVDTVLAIGSPVAEMEVLDGVAEMQVHGASLGATEGAALTLSPEKSESGGARNSAIPPRTKAYAKEKGIGDAELAGIPSATGKLMPSDVDAYLAVRGIAAAAGHLSPVKPRESAGGPFTEAQMPGKQRVLASRLVRSTQLVVPGTITVVADWEPIEELRAEQKAQGGDFQPSSFTMFAFAVAKALGSFPAFRSSLKGEDTIRTYDHASLGIAVGLPGDELVTAVVEEADALSWEEFAKRCRERIESARLGNDQANEAVTLSLTNMQNFGLRQAVPVLVAPSVGVLFLGEIYPGTVFDESGKVVQKRLVNLTLTFDHRLVNGVGAAQFMQAIQKNVEHIRTTVSSG